MPGERRRPESGLPWIEWDSPGRTKYRRDQQRKGGSKTSGERISRVEVETVKGWAENDESMREEAMYEIREFKSAVQRVVGDLRENAGGAC